MKNEEQKEIDYSRAFRNIFEPREDTTKELDSDDDQDRAIYEDAIVDPQELN